MEVGGIRYPLLCRRGPESHMCVWGQQPALPPIDQGQVGLSAPAL
jgi:hypothetical protein